MLTFTERVAGVDVPKTLYVTNDFTGRTVVGSNGVAVSEEFVMIGGVKLTGNVWVFLDAAQATTYGPTGSNVCSAVSNNNFALFANTNSNANCVITSAGA